MILSFNNLITSLILVQKKGVVYLNQEMIGFRTQTIQAQLTTKNRKKRKRTGSKVELED